MKRLSIVVLLALAVLSVFNAVQADDITDIATGSGSIQSQ